MASWQLQDAKARLSELIDKVESEGTQVITRRGVETVAVVPIDEWKRLTESAKPTLKDVLLSREFVFEDLEKVIPPRGKLRLRKPIDFE
jgi:prevent-host-death family protein